MVQVGSSSILCRIDSTCYLIINTSSIISFHKAKFLPSNFRISTLVPDVEDMFLMRNEIFTCLVFSFQLSLLFCSRSDTTYRNWCSICMRKYVGTYLLYSLSLSLSLSLSHTHTHTLILGSFCVSPSPSLCNRTVILVVRLSQLCLSFKLSYLTFDPSWNNSKESCFVEISRKGEANEVGTSHLYYSSRRIRVR